MKAILVPDCSKCPHRDYTSALAKGGAKHMCRHDTAVETRMGKEGGLSNLTIPKYPRIPNWCPLPDA